MHCFQYICSYKILLGMTSSDRLLCHLCQTAYAESGEPHLFGGVAQNSRIWHNGDPSETKEVVARLGASQGRGWPVPHPLSRQPTGSRHDNGSEAIQRARVDGDHRAQVPFYASNLLQAERGRSRGQAGCTGIGHMWEARRRAWSGASWRQTCRFLK